MALLPRFDTPGFLPDFNDIPGQLEAWNQAMIGWFDQVAAIEQSKLSKENPPGRVQFYNPTRFDPGPTVEQSIPWNGFPKELLLRYDRRRALAEADTLWSLSRYSAYFDTPTARELVYRPQNEYCEWHVLRDPNTQAIRQVTFTSEPPEYWSALAGSPVQGPDQKTWAKFPGNRDLLLKRYREFVGPEVQMEDLFAKDDVYCADGSKLMSKDDYNIYNKWNTTHGAVHLCAPPNSLVAEIQLAGDATIRYRNARGELADPDALICCAAYGGSDRNSDPTIGAAVNALTRLGGFVTLRNPVGLYMDHIDLAGWVAPDGGPVTDCVRIVRGREGLIERLVVAVPPGRGFSVSDIAIGGEPIRHGGQIAECITVHLVGLVGALGSVDNAALRCNARCCVDSHDFRMLNRPVKYGDPAPIGTTAAFDGEGTVPAESEAGAVSSTERLRHPRMR